ncbi:unnamed protein product [Angiostrongylus costaricensis]|uniref:Non-specific serine/threonine protein kinase n=1 Tax=Angiostrongylus costaricensis TaxID=334426 RepID=A0A158PGQ6_ANGCS|nr:unnamed protein product [Angiostrongylus costaricensis]
MGTSLGPFVSARSSCFDTSVQDANSKYRSEARELLNKWTGRERNGVYRVLNDHGANDSPNRREFARRSATTIDRERVRHMVPGHPAQLRTVYAHRCIRNLAGERMQLTHRTRSCSPVRPRHVVFKSLTSTEVPSLLNSKLPDVLSDSQKSSRVEKSHESRTGLSMLSKSSSIRENSCKRDWERPRKKTSQERTARRNSRQVGLTPSSSSSDEAFDPSLTRADVRRRRRRRKDSTKSVALLSAGASDTGMLAACLTLSDLFQSSDSGSVDDLIGSAEETDASSILDDESHYSAIVHFKPSKANTKRIAIAPPVPGLWKVANADEFISKNKQLVRSPCEEATTVVWTVRPHDTVRRILILPKRCVALNYVNKKDKAKAVLPGKSGIKKDEKKEISEVVKDQESNKKTSRIKRLVAMKSKPTEQESEKKTEVIEENKKCTKELVPSKIKDEVDQVNKSQSREVKVVGETEQKTPQLKTVKPKAKQEQPKEESIEMLVNLRSKAVHSQEVTTVRELPLRLSFKHPQKIREKMPLVTESVTETFTKKPAKLTFAKTLMEKRPTRIGSVATTKNCASSDNERTHPLPNTTPSSSQHLADSVVLDDAKSDEKRHEWSSISRLAIEEEYNSAGCLVLPDKSLLEEHVSSNRGRLGDEEPTLVGNEPRRDSPANSIANEILPACAIRVFECSPHGVPVITAPSRSVSQLSGGCSAEHTTTPTVMLDTLSSYNNYNSTPQGFLRDVNARIQITKPIAFDTPKTPFEERVQQQANAIRKAAATAAATTTNDGPVGCFGIAIGMTALSTSFTAAIAANANHGRHERYAAHIPVNRGDNSGQQNVVTQDNQQSDALDNATKQLDHVIDQARHKHSQHRSKFKEAIDYLDQIFEDLKKECDPDDSDFCELIDDLGDKRRTIRIAVGDDKGNAKERNQPITQPQAVSQADVIRRPSIIHPSNTKTTTNSSNRITRQTKQDQQSPATEVIVPPSVVVESEPSEFNVAETIVLPKKTDKLDFTRRWLRDDLSSLAHQPPTPIMLMPEPCSYYNDVDEHSLGSCSAEVAAINLNGRREKPKKSNGYATFNSLLAFTLRNVHWKFV